MALSATLVGSASNTTAGTVITVTTTASIPANATILLAIAADNSGTGGTSNLASITGPPAGVSNANPGVNVAWSTFTRSPGGVANDGAVIGLWVYNNGPSILASGAAFTFFFGTTTAKAAQVWYVSSSNSASYANKVTSAGNTGSGTSPTITTSITNGHLAIGFLAHESNSAAPVADSDTTNGTWSSATQTTANSGTSSTSMILYSQNKVVTATGNQTWNQSGFTSSDYANLLASFQEVTITTGSGSPTLGGATGSASGTPVAVASGTPSLATASASASGSPVVTSSGGSTLDAATASGAGTPVISGSGDTSLGDVSGAASGSAVVTSSGGVILGEATGAASGTAVATGAVAATLGDATGSATGTSVFSPSQLSPVLWLDASDTATITQSANSVSSWLDKSTNARTFTQSTASAKPTTNTRTLNGNNVLDFDGGDLLIGSGTTTDWKFLHDGTVYLIAAAIVLDTTTTTRYLLSTGSTTNSANFGFSSSISQYNYNINGTTTTKRALSYVNYPTAVGSTEVLGVLGDPAQTTSNLRIGLYADGYGPDYSAGGSGTLSTAVASQTLRIGGLTTTGSWDGAIAEIVVLTGANATDQNWQKLNNYLATKWGGSTVIYTDLNINGFSVGSYGDLTFSGVSGAVTSVYTATATPGDITLSGGAGGVTVAAVLSGTPTLGDATSTAVGTTVATGAESSTLGNATGSVVGSPVASATGAPTLTNATSSADARVVATGSATSTLADATSTAVGRTIATGSAAPTLGAATSSAAGTTTILSSGSSTLGAATSSGTAVAGSNTFVAATLADATASASGVVIAVSTGSPTLGAATGAAVGAPIAQSSGAVTLGAAIGAAQGQVIAVSSAAVTLGAAAGAAQGQALVVGSGAVTLSPATGSAIGSPVSTASGAATLQNATAIGLQSFPQTITTGVGTTVMTGLAGTSNIAVIAIAGTAQTTRGLITFTAVSGKTQQGVITLSGSHNAPQPGPITCTPTTGDLTLTANSYRPSEGFPAVEGIFVFSGVTRLPEITKHLAYWDGSQWRIARFKEWSGSGWVESNRVKAYGVSGSGWDKVY